MIKLTFFRLFITAIPLFFFLFVTGCSGRSESVIPHTGPPGHPTSPVSLKEGFPRPGLEVSNIEVVWEKESSDADFYWIRYGFHPEKMEHTLKIHPQDLHKESDPIAGELYIFLLKDIPTTTPVYVQIASERDGMLSPFSRVFEVPAQ